MIKLADSVFAHPASVQHGDVEVGEHSSLWPGSSIRGDYDRVTVGKFTSIQDNCTLHAAPHSPVKVGDYVTVGHGAVIHACTVEDACMVGMNSTILDRAVIGRGTIVAAGAVVTAGTVVPPGSMVMGVPAKVKPGRPGQEEQIKRWSLSYVALSQAYLEGGDTICPEDLTARMQKLAETAGF